MTENNLPRCDSRYELKYPVDWDRMSYFTQWLKTLGSSFKETYPSRIISNLYFDSDDLNCLLETREGFIERSKVRIRTYNNHSSALLEIKNKNKNMISKVSLPFSSTEEATRFLKNPQSGDYQLNGRSLKILSSYQIPTLTNQYNREYYEEAGGIRMTIDTNLKFKSSKQLIDRGKSDSVLQDTFGVIEFKYTESQIERFKYCILSQLPYRPGKFSKYQTGMESLGY